MTTFTINPSPVSLSANVTYNIVMYGIFGDTNAITWQSVSVGGVSLPLAAQRADPLGNPAAYFTPTEAVSGAVVITLLLNEEARSGMSWSLQQGDIDSSSLTVFQNGDFSTAPPPPPHVDLVATSGPHSVRGSSEYWLSASPIPDGVTALWTEIVVGGILRIDSESFLPVGESELPPNTMAIRFSVAGGVEITSSFQAALRYMASASPDGLEWKLGLGRGIVKESTPLAWGNFSQGELPW